MEAKDFSRFTTAEKIILAEQLWDSISKKEIEISSDVEKILDHRLQLLEEGKTELYSWKEVQDRINKVRK
ncbi:addiction module protein [Flavobacterium sp. j3]|jgi:putative addiction module component (TIGR02574 family)|uniref:Addiction module protein n=1 Tax=Flavobacterium aureirubrum TaxID=3133147 RepID=A0ABU9N479_9FLAO